MVLDDHHLGRRAEAVDVDDPVDVVGERGCHRHGQTAAERVADNAGSGEARDVVPPARKIELVHEPVGAAGVQAATVAVTVDVDGDRVVAEAGDPRCDAVPHSAVVPPAVNEEHRRLSGIAPLPQAERGAAERRATSARSGSGSCNAAIEIYEREVAEGGADPAVAR